MKLHEHASLTRRAANAGIVALIAIVVGAALGLWMAGGSLFFAASGVGEVVR
jgi:hypothetical protein